MFTPIASLFTEEMELTGKGSLLKRPISMLENPLKMLGVKIESNNGFLPIKIKGPLLGGKAFVDGKISSQVLTGLLIALPKAKTDSYLIVENLQSIPYINMTIEIMKHFGVEIKHSGYQEFFIKGNQNYQAIQYYVEGDWSGAAFHLVAAAINGKVTLNGLSFDSAQADKAILNAIELAGSSIKVEKNIISIQKKDLRSFEFDATQSPDLFPPLVILAAACNGISRIKGVNRLIHKESNRALVLQNEMKKIGIRIELKGDIMKISGGKISGGIIHSNNDHRIAMAGAIAGLISENPIEIEQAEAINKSYPGFFADFDKLV
jgi:3-phosphoshikimate 1-carboxyvinyltransferase